MSPTWNNAPIPVLPRPSFWQKFRMFLRGGSIVAITYFLMIFVLIFNGLERIFPTLDVAHPITRFWARICLRLCGARLEVEGTPMPHAGAVVSNHVGWIDIFALLSANSVYFVSKSEVSGWPIIGILSRQIGTVYIRRRRSDAKHQENVLHTRLSQGDRLCFFPEGTSSDGQRVLEFKSTLFSAFMQDGLREAIWVQPASVIYHPPKGLPPEFYGWWGEMSLGTHLQSVLALSSGGRVQVVFHDPVRAADFSDRKHLASHCGACVREGVVQRLPVGSKS